MRDVVITGAGLISPIGDSLQELKQAFEAGRSGVQLVEGGPGPRVMALVKRELTPPISRALLPFADRTAQLALIATGRAIDDAGIDLALLEAGRVGLWLGNALGPTETIFSAYKDLIEKDRVKPVNSLKALLNSAASHVAIQFGIKGRCSTVSAECSSSSTAIGDAMRAIRHGYIDVALAGGAEAPLGEGTYRAWEALRTLAKPELEHPSQSCRPFSKSRTGLVVGEGAAMFVLEAGEHARARGARILATVRGFGESSDAMNLVLPDRDGQVRAVRKAMRDADVSARDIGYVNAHGTATPAGDIVETQTLREAFGADADSIPVSSTKSLHGHLLGASGAIELCAALIALRDGLLAPTANLDVADPECDLDYVANAARQVTPPKAVMSNSFGFGGADACLVLG